MKVRCLSWTDCLKLIHILLAATPITLLNTPPYGSPPYRALSGRQENHKSPTPNNSWYVKYIKSQSVDNLRSKGFYEIKNIIYPANACFSKHIFALINAAQIAVWFAQAEKARSPRSTECQHTRDALKRSSPWRSFSKRVTLHITRPTRSYSLRDWRLNPTLH